MVEFTVLDIPCLGLNGGPELKHNEAFSFMVATGPTTHSRTFLVRGGRGQPGLDVFLEHGLA